MKSTYIVVPKEEHYLFSFMRKFSFTSFIEVCKEEDLFVPLTIALC